MSAPETGRGPVIVKKIIKRQEAGAHGGSWKVAYADFVTALMAFFLLMWLISMSTPEKRHQIANYFQFYNMFDKASASAMIDRGQGGADGSQVQIQAEQNGGGQSFFIINQDMKQKLKDEIESKLAEYKGQLRVLIYDEGIRMELMDTDGTPLFEKGSPRLSVNGEKIFKGVCDSIRERDNKIIIEGHTDALGYMSDKYTNWELSTDRASAARRELQNQGIDPDRLALVAGYAATRPLIKDNPNDPRNRRISLMLLIPNDRPFVDMKGKKGIVLEKGS